MTNRQELLLALLQRRRELAAGEELVDVLLGDKADTRLRANMAKLSANGYAAEGESVARRLKVAKLRVQLMEKYEKSPVSWIDSAEWKAFKETSPTARGCRPGLGQAGGCNAR